ncbi:MAG TPA: M23 family metallopeptidase [Vicinamibacterales bacterium]|jgi:murein DD-endopeptidase MepM/ murein hydrolase activator NlpD|nr:M23 family metallopeptidase [Vicinamibacterales bacterium]
MNALVLSAAIAVPLASFVHGQTPSQRGSADVVPRVTAKSRSVQPGELVVLTITPPARVDAVRVRAFGHEVAAFASSNKDAGAWQALVGIDLDVKPGTYPVAIDTDAGRLRTTYDLVVQPRRFPTRRLTVDESFVNPPPSERERIEQEARLLDQVWRAPSGERLWTEPFVRPVAEPANSRFGTRSIFNGVPRNPHGGADFLSPSGTPIHAPNAGRIAIARSLYFSGNTVVIDHGLGLFSMLAHLSVIDVHEGDRVSAGQIVGRVGATGRVTGAHLHWAVRANSARVDPLAVLALLGKNAEER